MINLINFSTNLYVRYVLIFLFFLLIGRSFVIVVNKYFLKNKNIPNQILQTGPSIVYPIIGLIFVGNILIFLNYFIPLKSPVVWIVLFLLISPNLLKLNNLDIKLKNFLTWDNFFYYIFIPGVLLISSSDINFHYDAAYYHLNHQNWLRETNLVIGMVNIFWPFGMSSIYEYISSIFWLSDSLIYLHFISLIFIHFFFSFTYFYIFSSRNNRLRNSAIFVTIFAFLDNFGLDGGRNGFIYIQEVGKQDIAVAILFLFASLILLNNIFEKKISKLDFALISLICFFIFELKVSGVFVFFLYFILTTKLIRDKTYSFKEIILYQLPTIIFGIIWSVKSLLTTSCLIFPLSFTCLKNVSWYEAGSTERIEEYTTNTSFAFMEYFKSRDLTFVDWFNDFFNSTNNNIFSNYYKTVYLNFLISAVLIFLLKQIFFNKVKVSNDFKIVSSSYILLGTLYLIFYGPIPRYSIGMLCTVIGIMGFYTSSFKVNIPKTLFFILFVFSLGLMPRLNSYNNYLNNANFSLGDPRVGLENNTIDKVGDWYKPSSGDRCWIDLNCTMEDKKIVINQDGFFRLAYKQ